MSQPVIQWWPVGADVWLRGQDVTAAMRFRASELAAASAAIPEYAQAYAACSEELNRQADLLDADISMSLTSQ